MLGNFEIKRPSLSLNANQANFSDLTGITSLFLCTTTTSLTLTNALTASNWIALIASKNIFPIHNIKDVQNDSEQPDIKESKQNFRYQARRGKYRFTCLVNVDVDYFIDLKKYEGQNLKAYFGDKNGNLIGVSDSTNFSPFTLSSIIIQKIGFGKFESSYVGITIDLAKPEEMESGYTFKPDFYLFDLVNEEVTISDISADDEYSMVFTVTNSCGDGITGLVATDFTLVDDISGTLTLDGFTEVGSGVYNYASVEQQYLGEIQLQSTKYNATADYTFSTPEFSPADFSSDFKIT